MTLWIGTLAMCVVFLVLLVLPGASVVAALTARPGVVLGAGPLVTVLLTAVVTLVMPLVGLPWTSVTGAAVLACACAVYPLRRLMAARRSGPRHRAPSWAGLGDVARTASSCVAAALPAAALQVGVLMHSMGRPYAILQNHDAMFHLNLIEEIRRTGDASTITAATSLNGGRFYSATFHALTAILPDAISTPLAFNIALVTIGALLLPFLTALLLRELGQPWWVCVLGPVAAMATMWAPALLLYFHSHAAAGLAIVLAPGALAALTAAREGSGSRRAAPWIVALLAVAALTAAHPGGGQWILIVLCVLGATEALRAAAAQWAHSRRRAGRAVLGAVVLLVPVALMPLVPVLREMAAFPRVPTTLGHGLAQALLLAPIEASPTTYLPLVVLAGAGIVSLLRGGAWHLPLVWLTGALLVVLISVPTGPWSALVGGFWGDDSRYLALESVMVGVLAAIGCRAILDPVLRWVRERPGRRLPAAVAPVLLVGLVLGGLLVGNERWITRGYQDSALVHPAWVSDAEMDLIVTDPADLFDDAVVYGVPTSGAGLVPVLSEGSSLFRLDGSVAGGAERYLAAAFSAIQSDPEVCRVIRDEGGTPLYYEDASLPQDTFASRYPGFTEVDTSEGFELVAVLDTAIIWRITACD
ncbi:MAG: hypothetical protein Q4C85_00440 [Actinomyces sp.]|uniref:DUF6541 family protein n=1 Tax=Actinomyces sp. TaxID=29317 RepID=UPI0026DBBC5F|nr:DUF6541 family protein [Actinomyces sp.]MDO4242230.1 hypothetical protein [Actinomyces sp.]